MLKQHAPSIMLGGWFKPDFEERTLICESPNRMNRYPGMTWQHRVMAGLGLSSKGDWEQKPAVCWCSQKPLTQPCCRPLPSRSASLLRPFSPEAGPSKLSAAMATSLGWQEQRRMEVGAVEGAAQPGLGELICRGRYLSPSSIIRARAGCRGRMAGWGKAGAWGCFWEGRA